MPDDSDKVKVRIETPFLPIPAEIASDVNLSSGAKLLFGCIFGLSMGSRQCYACNGYLARRIGLSIKQVKRLLPELENHELIVRKVIDHQRSEIAVVWRGKPIKMQDKMSKGKSRDKMSADKMSNDGGGSPKMSPPPLVPKCPHPPGPKMSPPHLEEISHPPGRSPGEDDNKRNRPTTSGSVDPSSAGDKKPEKLIPWRQHAYNAETVEDVCRAASEAGYTVGFREGGKLIDIALTQEAKLTNRHRQAMTEFTKRIRAAQQAGMTEAARAGEVKP